MDCHQKTSQLTVFAIFRNTIFRNFGNIKKNVLFDTTEFLKKTHKTR